VWMGRFLWLPQLYATANHQEPVHAFWFLFTALFVSNPVTLENSMLGHGRVLIGWQWRPSWRHWSL